ncbi:g12619 [Coccomyxa viridis]|uniref:G12619 protein n=1 Tax=Coccomyxa viridis TaxID=1274662 RepID=A0ABP1GDE0_9CHLO
MQERKDSLCDGSPDHKASKSSGQPQHDAQHDAQQDAPAQQEHGQPPSTDEAAENRQPEQQQQSDTDASAIDRDGTGWADSEMAQKFKEDLQRLSGQNKIERHVREDPTWFPVLLWDGLVAGPIRAFWHSRLLRYCMRNFEKSEFLEGSLDAFHMVLKVWSDQDWTLLYSMTSPRLSKVFREMSEEYAANRLTLHMDPEGELSASLREVKFLSPAGLARYEDDAKDSKEPEPKAKASTTDESGLEGFQSLLQKTADGVYTTSSQWHLVLTVVFHGSVKLTEVNAGGQVVREMIDKKPQKWRFCSTDTVALRETKAWQGLPLFLFEKLDATDPDQWELLEVV